MRTTIFALTLLAPGLCQAQPPPPPPPGPPSAATAAQPATPPAAVLTVDEAVRLAITQNPRLVAVVRDVGAARAGVRSARALVNPTLTFTPAITRGGSDQELILQQPLELNGARSARTGVARAELRRNEAEALVELRDLISQTRSAYYEVVRSRDLRTVAADLVQFAEEFSHGVRRQSEEGLRPGIDPVQTGIELSRARQQLTQAQAQVQLSEAALNTLIGRQAAAPLGLLDPLAFDPRPVEGESASRLALERRAEITAQEAQREAFRQEARLARAQGRPDLVPQIRADSITRGVSNLGIGLGISLPLFDFGGRKNRVRQAEEAARAQEARVLATRNQVRQEVEQAISRLRSAEIIIRDYQSGVLDQSRRLRDASLRALQLGAPGASILSVLEAQRTYRSVLTEYTNALAQYAQAQAELDRATGDTSADLLSGVESAYERKRESKP